MRRFLYGFVLIAVAVCFHFIAVYTGLYALQMRAGEVWFDNVLHALVGAAFVIMWLAVMARLFPKASYVLRAGSALAVVLILAASWEAFEYGFYLFFKSGALGLTVYEPSWQEAVWDSLSDIGGAGAYLAFLGVKEFFSAQG